MGRLGEVEAEPGAHLAPEELVEAVNHVGAGPVQVNVLRREAFHGEALGREVVAGDRRRGAQRRVRGPPVKATGLAPINDESLGPVLLCGEEHPDAGFDPASEADEPNPHELLDEAHPARARELQDGIPVRPDAGDELLLVERVQLLLVVGHGVAVEGELAGKVGQKWE